jgi:hypothetical protein
METGGDHALHTELGRLPTNGRQPTNKVLTRPHGEWSQVLFHQAFQVNGVGLIWKCLPNSGYFLLDWPEIKQVCSTCLSFVSYFESKVKY